MKPMTPLIRVLSIDPGSNMGVCISTMNTKSKLMLVQEAFTIRLDKYLACVDEELLSVRKRQDIIHDGVITLLTNLMNHHQVDVVVYEAAYVARSLVAYDSLTMYGRAITKAALAYDWDIKIDTVAPSRVKKVVGAVGNKHDKDLVTQAILRNPNIQLPDYLDKEILTEHAWDAIAIGYCVYDDLMRNLGRR